MSTIVYTGFTEPEKSLKKTLYFKAYLSPKQKEEILKELQEEYPVDKEHHVEMFLQISVKIYDTKTS